MSTLLWLTSAASFLALIFGEQNLSTMIQAYLALICIYSQYLAWTKDNQEEGIFLKRLKKSLYIVMPIVVLIALGFSNIFAWIFALSTWTYIIIICVATFLIYGLGIGLGKRYKDLD